MIHLSVDFGRLSQVDFLLAARHIHTSLTTGDGAKYFPVTSPTMAVLGENVALLAELVSLEKTSSNLTRRNAQRAVVDGLLHELAVDLEKTAGGKVAMLATTGYKLTKPRVRHTSPPLVPKKVRVKRTGEPGEALLFCSPQERTSFFERRCSLSPTEGPFIAGEASTACSKGLFQGLERGRDYYFQMRGVNSKGPGPWSNVVTMMVV